MYSLVTSVVNKQHFLELFEDRAIVTTCLPAGPSRDLAERAKTNFGFGDVSLRTRAELSLLFDLTVRHADVTEHSNELPLVDEKGQASAGACVVEDYLNASQGKADFFDQRMYMLHLTGTVLPRRQSATGSTYYGGLQLDLWQTDPLDLRPTAPPDQGILLSSRDFLLGNSGNRTRHGSKPSWRFDLRARGREHDQLVGMTRLKLKAMYNDPSQMREMLAWRLLRKLEIPASQTTYAKLAFDATYRGLFLIVEHVDEAFLKDHFLDKSIGNLNKCCCGDCGCATLEHRTSPDGDDSGRQYSNEPNRRAYRLRTNMRDPRLNTYDDLAEFIRTINGISLPTRSRRFNTDAYRESVDTIFDARSFLRWASANLLLGGWDNYFATASNYFLYNSGRLGVVGDHINAPYFTFIPWDYDNCLGIDYFGVSWQYADVLDWPASTIPYWQNRGTTPLPLIENLLSNADYRTYYLESLEHILDTEFNAKVFELQIGREGDGGLWDRVREAAYLESETPHGRAFTGRKFSNHDVYSSGYRQHVLYRGKARIEGILHYVRMRYDSARAQLTRLRNEILH
jgi:CotH kinase protein